MTRPLRAITLVVALALAPGALLATPLVGDRALPIAAQRTLAASVRAERTSHPERFAAVNDLAGLRPRVYRASRGGRPTVLRELRAMGREALLPMLDVLALSGYPRALTADERAVLEVGLLDAVGELRDRRAEPVLRAAFERMTSPESVRAAARALGRLGGDSEVAALSAAARVAGPRQAAALEGLGASRRDDAVGVIVGVLDGATEDAVVLAGARGLAEAGSSWAAAASGRDTALSSRCAAALVRAFSRTHGEARDAIMVAVIAVAAPDTPALLAAVRPGADADTRRALDVMERAVRRQLAH